MTEMKVSFLLGIVKLTERFLVMILAFASLVEISHPLGILYLLCALLLNHMGSLSLKILSNGLFFMIIVEYFLLIINYTNKELSPGLP